MYPLRPVVILEENTLGRPIEIVVLSVAERPEKRAKADQAKPHSNRHEKKKVDHHVLSTTGRAKSSRGAVCACRRGETPRNLMALATTINDDRDIAIAATSGVTKPQTASGTAIAL
jgi:hypothetical protein